jgi:chitodextrinase
MKLTALLLSLASLFGVNLTLDFALAQTAPSIAGCPIFPADNVWNTAIDHLPVDPNSSAYITTIGATKGVHPDFGSGLYEGSPIGIPYNVVPGTQPKVPISFYYEDESDPGPYPIPPDPLIEGGPDSDGDRHVLVLDKGHCVLYETFDSCPQPDGSWEAGSGAIFDLLSHDLRPDGWTSSDAAGLPILPGLVRYEEVASGEIRHAIRFTVPQTRKAYIWPARHYASSLTGTNYPPMGQRFRLKAGFDVSVFSPEVQVILQALKKYGMILADNGASWFISGVPDERWDNDMLVGELKLVKGSDFEAIDESSLMIDPDSGQARQTTPDTEPPTIPSDLTATPVSSTQIDLSWTPSTDNVAVAGYNIYRNGTYIGTSASTSYQSTGLKASTSYTYRVAAYDEAGKKSGKSAAVTKTTQPAPSTKFSIGNRVKTIEKANVRSVPARSGTVSGTQPKGAQGGIVGGPWYWNQRWWWEVDFDNGEDGWVAQGKLKKVVP